MDLRSVIRALLAAVALGTAVPASAAKAPAAKTPPPAAGEERIPGELPISNPKFTGDFDQMVERRHIRVLVVYSKTQYRVVKGRQIGTSYEGMRAFEDWLNKKLHKEKKLKGKHLNFHVVFVPTTRDQLIPALKEGRGDVAVASLTRTPEREKEVAFSVPTIRGINEVAVTGPGSPTLATVDDLAGKEVFVRKSSSYYEHLERLNERFRKEGKAAVKLKPAPENLEDEDLMEMVNAGLVGIVIVDEYKARLWAHVLKKIRVNAEVVVNAGGEIGWMMRKDNPQLKAVVDEFVAAHGQGTKFGNALIRRTVASPSFVKRATSDGEIEKFKATVKLFRKYGDKYDMDYLLMMAQGYQESRLDQEAKSPVGAVGVMQVMPPTGKDMGVGDIHKLEPNIHAGVKYMRFMIDQFYANEPMDRLNKGLFAFASYNAGPGRMQSLRKLAEKRGLDPNVWFGNVEVVTAEKIGAETVTYVANIYKYYIAYRLFTEAEEERKKAREALKQERSGK